MGRRDKVLPELKLKAVHEYLDNKGSMETIAQKYGVSEISFRKWMAKYKASGETSFLNTDRNKCYTADFKIKVVNEYISGNGSLLDLSVKYKIPSFETIRQWILRYNSHEKLKSSGSGGVPIMTKGRKTTYEERIEIVKYCIEHQSNYAETAQHFQVSYQQAYLWMTKYEKNGVEALQDKRGKRKSIEEMSEVERLKAENKLLQAENKIKQMEIDFLKKLEEIESGRY